MGDTEFTTKKFAGGEVLVANYIGKETEKGARKNSNIHHFKPENGEEVEYWGSTVLDGKLTHVEKEYGFGAKIQITCKGKVQSKKGGAEYTDFDVEVWEDQTIPF